VSVLGKAYLLVSLTLVVMGLLWMSMTLQENAAWVEVVLWTPRLDFLEPFVRRRYAVNLSGLLAGWGVAIGIAAYYAIRAPFRIRDLARSQRRLRELEREVLVLRTLPLRQHEEDEILAAQAHLDRGPKKVMTEKMQLDARRKLAAQEARPPR